MHAIQEKYFNMDFKGAQKILTYNIVGTKSITVGQES